MTTMTTLVHRAHNGPLEWWRDGLVYEVASPELGAVELGGVEHLVDHVASLGFTALLLRPSLMDARNDLDPFRELVGRAHGAGIRIVVRVSGALGPVTGPHARDDDRIVVGAEREGEGIVERAEAFLSAGADGIDLGTIIPPEVTERTDLARLTEYFSILHGLIAGYTDDGMIGADVSADYPRTLHHHLQEDWLHHLRDDALILARWDAESMTAHLTRSLDDHDRFGAPPVRRFLPSYRLCEATDPGDGRSWFAVDDGRRRQRATALQALALALPGSVYLRQGDEVGLPDSDKPTAPLELAGLVNARAHDQGSLFGSPLATVRHATHVRRERRLAVAPLAFVTGLDWCPPRALTLLARDVLVMVNTTDEPVILPQGANVLLSSQGLEQAEGRLMVPTMTTAWLDAASVS